VAMQVIGRSTPRVDGVAKVTGQALYTADLPREGVLWGRTLHSPYAHARIVRIDTSAAKALPGVEAVLTGAEIDSELHGSNLRDLAPLARDKVRFIGERVAAVAAIDEDVAQQALDLIEVEYEELPAVFDLLEAMEPDAPVLHEEFNTYAGVTETPGPGPFGGLPPLAKPGNRYQYKCVDRGDLEKGFAEADLIVENTYTTQRQHQGYLEPQTVMVDIDPTGRVNVWASSKMPHAAKSGLAHVAEVDPEQVIVHHTYIGGDFGGKGSSVLNPIAYFLAKATGRPVRMVNEYLEELMAGNPRHSTLVRLKTGLKQDGTMTAHHIQFYVNCGAYAAFKPGGIIFGPEQTAGPYHVANTRIEAAHVYTNTVPGGYMRGPGEAQAVFALESHVDELAHAVGMDPVQIRLKNLAAEGEETAFGVVFDNPLGSETVRAAADAAGWGVPKGKNIGRGIAVGERPPGGGIGNASVGFQPDGTVVLGTPIFDQGSGTYTIIQQVVAEELGLPLERVRIEVWNTDAVRFDSGVAGSWAARVNTGAVHDAVEAARKELLEFVANHLEWPLDSLTLEGDEVRSGALNESVRWPDLLHDHGEPIEGKVTHMAGMGALSHVTSFCAQAAEVEVDPETGEVKLLKLTTAHDVGRVLNPLGHQGQINGGIVSGLGYALMEELQVEDGRVTSLTLGDYKLPSIADLPSLNTVLVRATGEHAGVGPYDIKAIGEVPTTPVAPAIANAVFDAVGVRVRELPLTAEKVYEGLKSSHSQS
jgi:CO/xanthine dehydrogenase Mo-binding subunit